MAHLVLSPVKPAMLMPLKLLKAMMFPSPEFTPPMVPVVVSPAAIPQFPLPSGMVPVMSVPILLPWITTPSGVPPRRIPSPRVLITLPAPTPPMVVFSDWLSRIPKASA